MFVKETVDVKVVCQLYGYYFFKDFGKVHLKGNGSIIVTGLGVYRFKNGDYSAALKFVRKDTSFKAKIKNKGKGGTYFRGYEFNEFHAYAKNISARFWFTGFNYVKNMIWGDVVKSEKGYLRVVRNEVTGVNVRGGNVFRDLAAYIREISVKVVRY